MIYKTLKEKCEYYRSLTDYRLLPNTYVLVMIDGKNFASLIKNKFEKPFDNWFIETMNKTAEHTAKNIQNCVGAYVQSDEISFLIKDNTLTCMPFDGRLCKLQSIIPAIATSFFTKEIIKYFIDKNENKNVNEIIDKMKDYVFDCKSWVVPDENSAISWFLYRQIDCIRNSKQQFCQTYVPHKKLVGLDTDKQVQLCIDETGYDWNTITDNKKYGRFLYKDIVTKINDKGEEYQRKVWNIVSYELTNPNNRQDLRDKWLSENKIKES